MKATPDLRTRLGAIVHHAKALVGALKAVEESRGVILADVATLSATERADTLAYLTLLAQVTYEVHQQCRWLRRAIEEQSMSVIEKEP